MRRLLLIVCCLSLTFSAFGQTKEELQRQRTLLQDQIDLATSILEKTKDSKQASISELQTLNQKIAAREQLIATMGRQIRGIDRSIKAKEKEIIALTARVDSLKADYADLIRLAQLQQEPTDQILFILSSTSFTQAVKRIQYFKDMAGYRAQQVKQINEAQEALAKEKELFDNDLIEEEPTEPTFTPCVMLESSKDMNEGKKTWGLIAQEVEEVIPEVVKDLPEGKKAVAYQNIIGLLIEAIKDQQKQIDELKRKIK